VSQSIAAGAVAFVAALLAGAFSVSVFLQWRNRRKPHQLAWTVGLVLFALATMAEGLSEAWGWSDVRYRVFYFAAAANVAFLGLGSVYLAAPRAARYWRGYVVGTAIVFLALVGLATVDTAAFSQATPACDLGAPLPGGGTCRSIGGQAMPATVRGLFLVLNIPGALALLGIAAYSYLRTHLAFNLLILAGGIVFSLGGVMARLGDASFIFATNLAGIALMYGGFITSTGLPRPAAASEPAKAA
jgi:hypothetical protein